VNGVRRAVPHAAAVLLLAALPVAASPQPARAADSALVSAVPADGTALSRAPQYVALTFDQAPELAESHVGVADSTSVLLDAGELVAAGPRTVRQGIRTAAKGTVVVAYHMVFATGAEASGTIRFSVGTGAAPQAAAADAQRAAESATLGHDHGVDPLSAVFLVVDLGVLLGAVSLLVLRPRRRNAEDDQILAR
jgi:methionine-rich copper-binding protein CopC